MLPDDGSPQERLARELRRVTDRLRGLPVDRLARPVPGPPGAATPADLAHGAAEQLARVATRLDGVVRPPVPRLAPTASADLVAVTAADVQDAASAGARPAEEVAAALEEALAVLARLRRSLP